MDAKEYNKIMERLDFIEFRQQLLFDNDDVSRSIFEYGLTREQYKKKKLWILCKITENALNKAKSVVMLGLNRQCIKLSQTIEVIITCVRNLQKDLETRIDGKRFLTIYMEKCPSILI